MESTDAVPTQVGITRIPQSGKGKDPGFSENFTSSLIGVTLGSPQGLLQEIPHVGPVGPDGVKELVGARGPRAGFAIQRAARIFVKIDGLVGLPEGGAQTLAAVDDEAIIPGRDQDLNGRADA